jgi:GTP pyrophosphokinase
VVVEGVGNLMHHIARCCQPIPGDEIVGLSPRARDFRHRADCDQLAELQSHARSVSLTRSGEKATPRATRWWSAWWQTIVAACCAISPPFSPTKSERAGVASRSDTKQQLATIDMNIEIYNLQVLGRVLGKLNQVPDVIDARRLHGG